MSAGPEVQLVEVFWSGVCDVSSGRLVVVLPGGARLTLTYAGVSFEELEVKAVALTRLAQGAQAVAWWPERRDGR